MQVGRGAEREGDNLKQAPCSAWNLTRAQSHDREIMT